MQTIIVAVLFTSVYIETARADGSYGWSDEGHLTLQGAESWDELSEQDLPELIANSAWAEGHGTRHEIIDAGLHEAQRGLCGDDARSAYAVEPGAEWCSEYAREIYMGAGATDVYCRFSITDLGSTTCSSLSQARSVDALRGRFKAASGLTPPSKVMPAQVQPGDYLALESFGVANNHSALVVAISEDYRYVWTSEGNVDDCAHFMRRDFFVDGVLDATIDGVGNADKLF